MQEPLRLLIGASEDPLAFLAERNLNGGGDFLARGTPGFQFRLEEIHVDVGSAEDFSRDFVAFLEQSQQEVFGCDDLAPHLARLVAGQEEDLLRSLGILFEHSLPWGPLPALERLMGQYYIWIAGDSKPNL